MTVKLYYTGAAGIFTYRSAPSGKEYAFYAGTPTDVSIPEDVEYFKNLIARKGSFRIGPLVKKDKEKPKPKPKEKEVKKD